MSVSLDVSCAISKVQEENRNVTGLHMKARRNQRAQAGMYRKSLAQCQQMELDKGVRRLSGEPLEYLSDNASALGEAVLSAEAQPQTPGTAI